MSGEAGRKGGCCCEIDRFRNVIRPLEHIDIPEADDTAAMRFEPARADFIVTDLLFIGMRRTVDLDDQSRLGAEEIRDVGSDSSLPPETETGEPLAAQQQPKLAFAFGHVPA